MRVDVQNRASTRLLATISSKTNKETKQSTRVSTRRIARRRFFWLLSSAAFNTDSWQYDSWRSHVIANAGCLCLALCGLCVLLVAVGGVFVCLFAVCCFACLLAFLLACLLACLLSPVAHCCWQCGSSGALSIFKVSCEYSTPLVFVVCLFVFLFVCLCWLLTNYTTTCRNKLAWRDKFESANWGTMRAKISSHSQTEFQS